MICDVGMTGALNSSIGQTYESRIAWFLTGNKVFWKWGDQDLGPGVVNALYVEIENVKCVKIEKIRIRESEEL
jgi:calcineurin-like phosphoesterase